jgi:hypothetical protein
VTHRGEDRKLYKVLVLEIEGKRALRRTSCRWKDGNILDLGEIDWEYSGFCYLSIGQVACSCEHGDESSCSGATELVGWLVGWLVRRLVGRVVGWLVCWLVGQSVGF